VALERLRRGLERFRQMGAEADGEVGDHRPIDAIGDALRDGGPFDEIIISTLPPGRSRWLKLDLPHRVEAAYGVSVTHVIGQPEAAGTKGSQ
jgi:GABA permease